MNYTRLMRCIKPEHPSSMKILADSTLPHLTHLFAEAFELAYYSNEEELDARLPFNDILICRSTQKINAKRLENTTLQCVATASSGIDHIDTAYLKTHRITLFDAKGCNAEAVADYVMSTLAWLVKHQHLSNIHAGVIGLGEVGTQVTSRLHSLQIDAIPYDPPRAALDASFQSAARDALTACNLLFIHANLHETAPFPSKNLIDATFLSQLQAGTVIINASRGGIVNEEALLKTTKPLIYCTDVYQNEPRIDPRIVAFSTLCTPHIAGHSIEAKSNALERIARALHTHFNLPMPPALTHIRPEPQCISTNEAWSDYLLRLYDPFKETLALKKAIDKQATFQKLRKAHHFRHNFTMYHPDT